MDYSLLKNKQIQLISKKQEHGSLGAFIDLFNLGKPKFSGRKIYFKVKNSAEFSTLGASQVDTYKQTMTLVAKLSNTIAYDSLGALENMKHDSLYSQIKIISIDGIKPTVKTVASGQYIIKRPLSLIINKNKTNTVVEQCLQYIKSPEGKTHVVSQGYIAK